MSLGLRLTIISVPLACRLIVWQLHAVFTWYPPMRLGKFRFQSSYDELLTSISAILSPHPYRRPTSPSLQFRSRPGTPKSAVSVITLTSAIISVQAPLAGPMSLLWSRTQPLMQMLNNAEEEMDLMQTHPEVAIRLQLQLRQHKQGLFQPVMRISQRQ
jgi:hypothetical protein